LSSVCRLLSSSATKEDVVIAFASYFLDAYKYSFPKHFALNRL